MSVTVTFEVMVVVTCVGVVEVVIELVVEEVEVVIELVVEEALVVAVPEIFSITMSSL